MRTKLGFVGTAIAIMVLITCTSDTSISDQNPMSLDANESWLLSGDIDDYTADHHKIEIEDIKKTSDPLISQRHPNSIVRGNYHTQGDHFVQVSATENPGEIHGSGRITGPVYIDIQFNVDCVTEVGNRATVGGEITSIELAEQLSHLPYDVGWIIYIAVEDNGEGHKADSDRYHTQIYFGMPGFGLYCDLLEPTESLLWIDEGWFDVAKKGDRILVK